MRLATLTQRQNLHEPLWHVVLAVATAIGLQLAVKDNVAFGPKYAIASLEILLLLVLAITPITEVIKRLLAIILIGLIVLANSVSLSLVVAKLLSVSIANGRELLLSAVAIYLTNIIVFGILYWELDGTKRSEPDFLFAQFTSNQPGNNHWHPSFFDYLYVSVTNASAFSPTDTLPLTHRAKLLMTIQSLTALITVALVAARAVNILS